MTNPARYFSKNLPAAVILYLAVIIYQGYQYGLGDQSQILPVLYALEHPGSYSTDHYVNFYLNSGFNERTVFHFLFQHAGYDIPGMVFLWHSIFSIVLLLAWLKIAGLFIANRGMQYLAIAGIFILGFHTSVGSNELYYNQFIPSLPGKAFASWALYFWLEKKYNPWSILLIVSGLLQPLVGLQLFLLTVVAQGIMSLFAKQREHFPFINAVFAAIFFVPFIYFLAVNNGGHKQPGLFMDIMEFRLSHHFFPACFGAVHILVFLVLSMLCLFFYKGKLKWFALVVLAGCILYVLGVEIIRSPIFLYTQWWKTTIWIEAFGIIAFITLLETKFSLQEKFTRSSWLILPGIVSFAAIYRLSGIFGEPPLFMAPLSQNISDDVDIAIKAKNATSEDAVFIMPPDLTAFRWYSKRNSYVDYKALFHQEDFLTDWYERIRFVYQYDLSQKRSGTTIYESAQSLSNIQDQIKISEYKLKGITHLISTNHAIEGLYKLSSNKGYSIYEL